METTKYVLKDLLTIKNGKDHKALADGSYPVFGTGGVMRYAEKYLYDKVSILLPRKGTLTNIQYVDQPFWTVDTIYYTVVNEKLADPYYLFCYVNSLDLSGYDSGASIPSMTQKAYNKIKINLPDKETQKTLGEAIKAYDDLIENNNKRIAILEQMAENLYKEWFVRFRFPGYEVTEFKDGIPVGWEFKRLGDELTIKRGGSPRPIQDFITDVGLKWLKISDATKNDNPFIFDIDESIKEEGLKKTVYRKAGSLVLSNSATPGLPRILALDTCIHDGWLYFENQKLSNEFLFLFFNHIRPNLVNKGNGAVFTNLKTDILKKYSFVRPSDEVLTKFDDVVKPIFKQIYSVSKQNQNLIKQRDLLLPRLMSGKLEV